MTARVRPPITRRTIIQCVAISVVGLVLIVVLSIIDPKFIDAAPVTPAPTTTVVLTRSTQTDGQGLLCSNQGACIHEESPMVTRPPAVLPGEVVR